MPYLSQYTLSLMDVRALRLTDSYSLHRIVYDLFSPVSDDASQAHRGILFADKGGDARERRIHILSHCQPREAACGTLKTHVIPTEYFAASVYNFEITLNPVRRNNQSGKLIPMREREEIATWFCHKAPTWGFHIHEASLLVARMTVDSFTKKGQTVTLSKATLTGRLVVQDRDLFTSSVLHGIGRGRAFGCGLLQIVPV